MHHHRPYDSAHQSELGRMVEVPTSQDHQSIIPRAPTSMEGASILTLTSSECFISPCQWSKYDTQNCASASRNSLAFAAYIGTVKLLEAVQEALKAYCDGEYGASRIQCACSGLQNNFRCIEYQLGFCAGRRVSLQEVSKSRFAPMLSQWR